jgi:hypothetical protein
MREREKVKKRKILGAGGQLLMELKVSLEIVGFYLVDLGKY